MTANQWMPWYISDYLGSTMHLTTTQHGAYWKGQGPLSDDDVQLAAICRLNSKEWKKHKPVLARFFTIDNGFWRQKRSDFEISKWNSIAKGRSTAGKAAANTRWGRDRAPATNDASRIREAMREQSTSPSPLPEHTHTHTNGGDVPPDSIANPPTATSPGGPRKSESRAWGESPSWAECRAWGATAIPDSSTGVPKIDLEWLFEWWEWRQNEAGWDIANWHGSASAKWRKQWQDWARIKAKRKPQLAVARPSASSVPRPESIWERKQRMDALQAAIDEHPANRSSTSYVGGSGVTPAMESSLKEMRAKLSASRKEIAGPK